MWNCSSVSFPSLHLHTAPPEQPQHHTRPHKPTHMHTLHRSIQDTDTDTIWCQAEWCKAYMRAAFIDSKLPPTVCYADMPVSEHVSHCSCHSPGQEGMLGYDPGPQLPERRGWIREGLFADFLLRGVTDRHGSGTARWEGRPGCPTATRPGRQDIRVSAGSSDGGTRCANSSKRLDLGSNV